MINLAKKGDISPIADISFEESISESFLEKIFQELRRAKLVEAKKGALGGYSLARSPELISVKDLFTALGEVILPPVCAEHENCPRSSICSTKDVLSRLERVVSWTLGAITLADLVASENGAANKLS